VCVCVVWCESSQRIESTNRINESDPRIESTNRINELLLLLLIAGGVAVVFVVDADGVLDVVVAADVVGVVVIPTNEIPNSQSRSRNPEIVLPKSQSQSRNPEIVIPKSQSQSRNPEIVSPSSRSRSVPEVPSCGSRIGNKYLNLFVGTNIFNSFIEQNVWVDRAKGPCPKHFVQ
jgi:hypothetical protein